MLAGFRRFMWIIYSRIIYSTRNTREKDDLITKNVQMVT